MRIYYRHILPYTSIYRHMTVYHGICRYGRVSLAGPGFQTWKFSIWHHDAELPSLTQAGSRLQVSMFITYRHSGIIMIVTVTVAAPGAVTVTVAARRRYNGMPVIMKLGFTVTVRDRAGHGHTVFFTSLSWYCCQCRRRVCISQV
jgi:hypothetical protein